MIIWRRTAKELYSIRNMFETVWYELEKTDDVNKINELEHLFQDWKHLVSDIRNYGNDRDYPITISISKIESLELWIKFESLRYEVIEWKEPTIYSELEININR